MNATGKELRIIVYEGDDAIFEDLVNNFLNLPHVGDPEITFSTSTGIDDDNRNRPIFTAFIMYKNTSS